jgi:hypothetical protein
MISIARERPVTSGRRSRPPPPGKNPKPISGWQKIAFSWLADEVDVRHVEVGVGAVEDDYLHVRIGVQAVDEIAQARDDLRVVQVDRRVVEGDAPVDGGPLVDADRGRERGHRSSSHAAGLDFSGGSVVREDGMVIQAGVPEGSVPALSRLGR